MAAAVRVVIGRSRLQLSIFSLTKTRIPIFISCYFALSTTPLPFNHTKHGIENASCHLNRRYYHDGRPRGSLWRGKKLLGKEALFVILGLKRLKHDSDQEKLGKFVKVHVSRLLKMDMVAVLNELERQQEVQLAVKVLLITSL